RRARASREPHLTAVAGSVFFFFAARLAFMQGGLTSYVGVVPIVAAAVLALLLRELLVIQPAGERDLGRLAFVAGGALAFAPAAAPGNANSSRGGHPAAPAPQHRDSRLLRRRTRDHAPVRRHARTGPHLHDRMAVLRSSAADRRHLRPLAARPCNCRRAHRD